MNLDRLKYRYWQHTDWHDTNSPLEAVYCNIVDGCDPTIAVSDFEFCTGLKDKNGNLIYEGDLLGGFPVVWVNELNGFRIRINTIHGWDWHYINEFTNREITGNIHEQAEQKD